MAGYFNATGSFAGQTLPGPATGASAVLAGYRAADGAGLWAESYSTTATPEALPRVRGYDVAASPAGNLFVTGTFSNTMSAEAETATSFGGKDVFLLSTAP